ncbi:hypothetical protein C7U70_19750 [Escherichia coli]|nr:hypothetical protein C7U70_19750 [Escherichia coli]
MVINFITPEGDDYMNISYVNSNKTTVSLYTSKKKKSVHPSPPSCLLRNYSHIDDAEPPRYHYKSDARSGLAYRVNQ